MVPPARPRSLLDEAKALFTDKGWPVTDLAQFRMALDDDAGSDDGADDDNGDDDDRSGDGAGGDDVAKMKKALNKANKEAESFRLKLKEYEDRDKSETEKLTERSRELESNLTSAELRALRYEIALDKGIPKSIASRLQGSTREEMESDADELLKTLGNGNGDGRRKTASFDGGPKEKDAPSGSSFLAQALRDRRS